MLLIELLLALTLLIATEISHDLNNLSHNHIPSSTKLYERLQDPDVSKKDDLSILLHLKLALAHKIFRPCAPCSPFTTTGIQTEKDSDTANILAPTEQSSFVLSQINSSSDGPGCQLFGHYFAILFFLS